MAHIVEPPQCRGAKTTKHHLFRDCLPDHPVDLLFSYMQLELNLLFVRLVDLDIGIVVKRLSIQMKLPIKQVELANAV